MRDIIATVRLRRAVAGMGRQEHGVTQGRYMLADLPQMKSYGTSEYGNC
jgi:hypothetical protein